MRALTVDFMLIAQCMRDLPRDHNEYFLERNTGKVITLSRDLIGALAGDGFENREKLPQWDAQMIPVARKIVLDGSKDYVRIPEAYGRPAHTWQLAFTDTIRSIELKKKLNLALKGRGSCKRFKTLLDEQIEERSRWKTFHENCWKERITRWLENQGILAFDQKPCKVPVS